MKQIAPTAHFISPLFFSLILLVLMFIPFEEINALNFLLGPSHFDIIAKKVFNSAGIQIDTVTRPVQPEIVAASRNYILNPGEKIEGKIHKNLFVRAKANKSRCYVGEPILITYKLYSRINAISKITRQPTFDGFAHYDILENIPLNETIEQVDGLSYKVHVLKKAYLVPLQTGDLQLDPMELESNVHFIKTTDQSKPEDQLQDVIDQMLQEEKAPAVDWKTKITSKVVSVSVEPLSEVNRPIDFNGAIGRFTINAYVLSKNIASNDVGTQIVELKGSGYLPLVNSPVIQWPLNIESLTIRETEKYEQKNIPILGTKRFEYTFKAIKKGKYQIPAIRFSFFNPLDNSFNTIQSQPQDFEVTTGKVITSSTSKVHSSGSMPTNNNIDTFNDYLRHYYLQILMLFALFVCTLYFLKIYLHAGIKLANQFFKLSAKTRNQPEAQLHEEIPGPLARAIELSKKSEYIGFYRELNNVLWNALVKKIELPLTELNKNNVVKQLRLKGWSNEMIENLQSLLIKCEKNIYISDYQTETDLSFVLLDAQKVLVYLHSWE